MQLKIYPTVKIRYYYYKDCQSVLDAKLHNWGNVKGNIHLFRHCLFHTHKTD